MKRWIKPRMFLVLLVVVGLSAALLYVVHRWLVVSVLPDVLRTQLTAALKRDVTFTRVDTDIFSYLSVHDLVVAKGKSMKEGSALAAKELIVKYRLIRLLLAPKAWTKAIRRVEVIEPEIELALEEVLPRRGPAVLQGKTPANASESAASQPTTLLPLPKTFVRVKGGTVRLTWKGVTVLEIRRFRGDLDLRVLPRIEGSIDFVVAPETVLAADGYCNLRLKSFKGRLSVDRLNLGQFSDVARMVDPGLTTRVGGRLKADLKVRGGFMTFDELIGKTTGHGSLKLEQGSLTVRGASLISDMAAEGILDGRRIALEWLRARVLSGTLQAAGSLDNLGQGKLRLRGRLDGVPVQAMRVLSPGLPDTLEGNLTFEFSATGTGRAPVFYGRLTAPVLGVPGVFAEHFIAEAEYSIGELKLTNLKATLWEGAFVGEGVLRGLDTGSPQLNIALRGAGINVAHSPVGKHGRFTGRGELYASLEGPPAQLKGHVRAEFSQVAAKGVPVGDLVASARFEGGKITIDVRTTGQTVVATGTLAFDGEARFEGCQVVVQDHLPLILALTGVKPPKGFRGRGSGKFWIDGPLAKPVITAEAVGSAVRFGKVVIGDVVRIPKIVYRNNELYVPQDAPLELYWGPEDTRVTAYGTVPISAFSKKGTAEIDFHVACDQGRMEVLKRLGQIGQIDGDFSLHLDVGGTASYPVWTRCALTGQGKNFEFNTRIFEKPIKRWNVNVRVDESGGVLQADVMIDKQIQSWKGPVNLDGWNLGFDLETWTHAASGKEDDLKGLPLLWVDVAKIRTILSARLLKEPGSEAMLITGLTEGEPAELRLSNGVILYDGMENPATKDAKPDPLGAWALRALNIQALVDVGDRVAYKPKSFAERRRDDIFKAVKSVLMSDTESGKQLVKQYANIISVSGLKDAFGNAAVGFNVGIREGSTLLMEKRADQVTAKGKLLLDPGGTLSLLLPSVTSLIQQREFIVVEMPGRENYVEFEPGEELQASVNIVGETVLYNENLQTNTGELALVDELNIHMVLTPRSHQELEQAKEKPFLNFNIELRAEPQVVTGEILEATNVPEGQSFSRRVSFKPDESALFGALTGASGGGLIAGVASSGVLWGLNFIFLKPFKAILNLVGVNPDISLGKSSVRRRRSTRTLANQPGSGSEQNVLASALDNTELTIGKRLTKNVYANLRMIYLDSLSITDRAGSSLAETKSNSFGSITELSYRTSRYKGTLRGRWFGLPDDSDLEAPYEIFLGGEMRQRFSGVNQREAFAW